MIKPYTNFQINIFKHDKKSVANLFDGLMDGQTDKV